MYRPTPTPNTMMRTAELAKEKERKVRNLADFIKQLIGEKVVIVARNGIIYEGTLIGKEHSFLILKDTAVKGSKYTAKVSTILIKPDIIQHIHESPKELTENKTTQ